MGQTERDTGPMNPYRADKPGGADIYRWCMNTLDPNLARPCLVCLLAEGDDILLPIQRNGVGPVEHHRATVTRLEDDEPNRRIRMTVRIHSLDTTATNEVKPGDLLHRVIDGNDPQSHAYVRATDLWKWEGLIMDDPDGNGKVRLIRAVRGPHPTYEHEILALVVEDGQQQRRPVFLELTGGLFCDWD